MLRKIKVYGRLRKLLGWENGVYWADVNSTAEVGRFIVANWPHVKKHMVDQFYKVKTSGYEIGEEEINNPIGQEISIVPVAVGAKKFFSSGWGKIIIGAVIVGVVIATGGFGGLAIPALYAGGASIGIGTIVAGIGISLALSGVSQLLADNQEQGSDIESHDPNSNYQFSGVNNISRSGVPLPLIYGYDVYVGSIVISNGIDTVQGEG